MSAQTTGNNDEGLGKRSPLPRWVPITLLSVTTAAIIVPVVLLRRHQQSYLVVKSMKGAPPPPRRTSAGVLPGANPPRPMAMPGSTSTGGPLPRMVSIKESLALDSSGGPSRSAGPVDDFNAALYIAKAFGTATAIVFASAATTIWGVKSYLGVNNTAEFAERMREIIQTHMPVFFSRMHREASEEDGIFFVKPDEAAAKDPLSWTWTDAEKRLTQAYEKNGFSGWAEAAMRELEAEDRVERLKGRKES